MNSNKSSNATTTNLTGVIAEIGNHHLGSVEQAKTMIYEAHRAGADFVKMQAIDANFVALFGSMPKSFYKACELTTEQYIDCMKYGRSLGTTVFFSIFGTKHAVLTKLFNGSLFKISGGQFQRMTADDIQQHSSHRTIVSIPEKMVIPLEKRKAIWPMQKMMVTPYLPTKVDWGYLEELKGMFPRVGYSDHTRGIEACKTAIKDYGCRLIEKHFHLGTDIVWEGQRYRDCQHAVTPDEFMKLTKFFKSQL